MTNAVIDKSSCGEIVKSAETVVCRTDCGMARRLTGAVGISMRDTGGSVPIYGE